MPSPDGEGGSEEPDEIVVEELYEQTVTVCFDTFMRAEQKFASAELLKEQIDKDTAAAAEYFRTHTIHTDSI